MDNYAYDPNSYVYSPAGNIERTFYGTTVVRVAEDRPLRPQMMMPFMDTPPGVDHSPSNAFKFHTVRATRLGTPVAITIEPPPTYAQAQGAHQYGPAETLVPTQINRGTWSHLPLQDPAAWPRDYQVQQVHSVQQLLPPAMQQICIAQPTQHIQSPNLFRPSPGRLISYEGQGKSPVEMYAPRSFATDDESQPSSEKRNIRKKRKDKKKREKVIVTAKVTRENKKAKQSKNRRKQREAASSSSSGSSLSSSELSSSESEMEETGQKTAVETPKQKKMRKGPKVNHYLEYAIASLFWNVLFGTVAVVLSVSSMNSKKMRKFKQSRWEGVFAAVTATLGLVVSVVIVIVVLLYLYTSTICDNCDD